MTIKKSPGAGEVAHGASIVDQLGRQVIPEVNPKQQPSQPAIRSAGGAGDRAMMAAYNGGAQQRPASVAGVQAGARTAEQRSADLLAAHEFHQIKKFVAACRQQWPGAKIVLRPNESGPPPGAGAPLPNQNLHQRT
jgi:hypothetical protein